MTATFGQQLRSFSRDIQLFLLAAVLVAFAWDGVRMVLFNLYLLRLGYGPELVGLINASNALIFALTCLPAGAAPALARWSSRNLLIVGAGLMTLGLCLLPISEFVPAAWRVAWLLAIGLPTHGGQAIYLVHSLPFMMDTTRPAERSYVFSLQIAISPLAAFAGSLTAGFLPPLFGQWLGISPQEAAAFRYPLLLNSLILIPALLVLTRTGRSSTSQADLSDDLPTALREEAGKSGPPYGLLLVVALVTALHFGGRSAVVTFFNVYLDDGLGTSTALIGALVAAGQLVSVPAALSAPSLVARRGPVPTITRGMLGVALATLPLALVPHWTAAAVGYIASTALFSTAIGPIRLYFQELVAPAWRAIMAASFMLGSALAFALMSLAGGYAITVLGYDSVFLTGAALTAVGALVFWAFFRVPRGELARVAAAPAPAVGGKDTSAGASSRG